MQQGVTWAVEFKYSDTSPPFSNERLKLEIVPDALSNTVLGNLVQSPPSQPAKVDQHTVKSLLGRGLHIEW